MKSVGSKRNFSEWMDNQSLCKSTWRQKKKTVVKPFNLSNSNARQKPKNDESMEKYKFKARKIPKTHKLPFMVYHSTKDLTSFKNVNQLNKKWGKISWNKVIAKTPYEELWKQENLHPTDSVVKQPKDSKPSTKGSHSRESSLNPLSRAPPWMAKDYKIQPNLVSHIPFLPPKQKGHFKSFSLMQADKENSSLSFHKRKNSILSIIDHKLNEIDSESSRTIDNASVQNEQLTAKLASIVNGRSQLDNSFDSKDTLSICITDDWGETKNIFGDVDIDQLVNSKQECDIK